MDLIEKYLGELKLVKGGIYKANKSGNPIEVQLISVENHMGSAIVTAELIHDPKGIMKKEIGSILKIDRGNFGRSFKKIKTPSIV